MRSRRRFDHLVMELSLATGTPVPRYPLWLAMHEHGFDPERLTRSAAVAFCQGPLGAFLADRGLALRRRAARRLMREIGRFDPDLPTPDERLARL